MAIIIEKTPIITTAAEKEINSGTILATVLVLAIIGAFVYLFSGAGQKTSVIETNNTTTRFVDRQAPAPAQLPPEVPTPAYNPPSQTTVIERQVQVPVAVPTATPAPAPAQPTTSEPAAQTPEAQSPAVPDAG